MYDNSMSEKNSRRLELLISQKNTAHGRWGQGPGSVDPRFPDGLLPFLVPEVLELVAFRDLDNFSSNSPFQEFSSGTPEQTLEIVTAFTSFLDVSHKYLYLGMRTTPFLLCLLLSPPLRHDYQTISMTLSFGKLAGQVSAFKLYNIPLGTKALPN